MAVAEEVVSSLTCNLPGEIVMTILSQLPVKSLMRFSCVKKSWNSLFKHPIFVKMHTDHHHPTTEHDECFLVASHNHSMTELSVIHSQSNEWKPIGIHEKENYEIVGSSNGLICLRAFDFFLGNIFMILNPATREVKLTNKKLWLDLLDACEKKAEFGFGFGYDEEHDDFKIMLITKQRYEKVTFCHVYSLKADSWKEVKISMDLNFVAPNRKHRKYNVDVELHNHLYWPANGMPVVAKFNLGSEEIGDILLPYKSETHETYLLKWRQKELASVYYNSGHRVIEVWTLLIEHEDVDLWIKEFTFRYPSEVAATVYCSRRNGDFVCCPHNREAPLLLYLNEENKFKDLRVQKKLTNATYKVVVYKESLVRLNGNTLINGTSKINLQKQVCRIVSRLKIGFAELITVTVVLGIFLFIGTVYFPEDFWCIMAIGIIVLISILISPA